MTIQNRHHKGSSYYAAATILSIALFGAGALMGGYRLSYAHFELLVLFGLLFLQVLLQTAILRRHIPMAPQGDGLSAYIFILFITTNPLLYQLNLPVVSSFFVSYSIFILFYIYHTDYSAVSVATSAFVFGVASVLWLPNILFLPIFIWSLYSLRSFHLRSILAYILGLGAAWWIAFPIFFFTNSYDIVIAGWRDLIAIEPFWKELDLKDVTVLSSYVIQPGMIFLLTMWALQSAKIDYWRLKMRVRANTACLMNISLFTVLIYLVMGKESISFIYIGALPISILLAQSVSFLRRKQRIILTNIVTVAFLFNFFLRYLV